MISVRTDDEIPEILKPEIYSIFTACEDPFWVRVRRYLKEGCMFDAEKWAKALRSAAKGDITFEEGFFSFFLSPIPLLQFLLS